MGGKYVTVSLEKWDKSTAWSREKNQFKVCSPSASCEKKNNNNNKNTIFMISMSVKEDGGQVVLKVEGKHQVKTETALCDVTQLYKLQRKNGLHSSLLKRRQADYWQTILNIGKPGSKRLKLLTDAKAEARHQLMADGSVLQCGTKLMAKSEFGVKENFPTAKSLVVCFNPIDRKVWRRTNRKRLFFGNWQNGRAWS